MYLFAPISLNILDAYPSFRPKCPWLGLAIVCTGLLAASFAKQVWQLIITQGVMYAVGGSFLYAPLMGYLDEWFIEKKGLAFGITWGGVGLVRSSSR